MKCKFFGAFFFAMGLVFMCMPLQSTFAQNAEELEAIHAKKAISWADACRWVYGAAGMYPFYDADIDIYKHIIVKRLITKKAGFEQTDLINYKELSRLILDAYGIKGGLFYRMTRLPRYGFRELVFLGIYDRNCGPGDKVSGTDFLTILKRMEAYLAS